MYMYIYLYIHVHTYICLYVSTYTYVRRNICILILFSVYSCVVGSLNHYMLYIMMRKLVMLSRW